MINQGRARGIVPFLFGVGAGGGFQHREYRGDAECAEIGEARRKGKEPT